MITVIGLGAERGDVTARGLAAAKAADRVFVRTQTHPSAQSLTDAGIAFESFDAFYERSRSYDALVKNIVREVRRAGKEQNVCYCVDGSPAEDRAARALMQYRQTIAVDGVSKASAAAAKAGIGDFLALSAYDVTAAKLVRPLVVYDLADRVQAADVKLALCDAFGDESPAFFVCGSKAQKIALFEADRQKSYDATCALVLPDVPLLEKKRFDLWDFIAILKRLRAPDGCPWDRVQTHSSIRINAIEEAYELVDAIDADDPAKMCEEAGDVIMQAAFHTLIEEERGNFNMTDVLSEVCEKLITRHTHVFGSDRAAGADGALTVWEKNKMKEKGQETFSDSVNDVPEGFPALLRAQKVRKRMEKGGWARGTAAEVSARLSSSLTAFENAKEKADAEAALSEILWECAALGRTAGVDCEQALLDRAKRAQKEYTAFEARVLADGKDVNALSAEERARYMDEAKRDS